MRRLTDRSQETFGTLICGFWDLRLQTWSRPIFAGTFSACHARRRISAVADGCGAEGTKEVTADSVERAASCGEGPLTEQVRGREFCLRESARPNHSTVHVRCLRPLMQRILRAVRRTVIVFCDLRHPPADSHRECVAGSNSLAPGRQDAVHYKSRRLDRLVKERGARRLAQNAGGAQNAPSH